MQRKLFYCLLPLALMAGCKEKTKTTGKEAAYHAIDAGMLDSTIKPGDDFYKYVNAKWIASNPIPADKSRFGTFDMLDDNSLNTLRTVMEDASKANAAKGTNTQKVGDFWSSAMDTVSINKAGIEPLKPYLDQINAIANTDDVIKMLAGMHRTFNFAMFSNYVGQDAMNSTQQIMNLNQGGLGLPDRDYYTRNDDKAKKIRTDYVMHIKNLMTLSGQDEAMATKNADLVMKMETSLAAVSMDRVMMRDPYAVYHKMTTDELAKNYGNINWKLYFTELKTPSFNDLNVSQPDFFKGLNGMLKSTSLDDWKVYLTYHLIDGASPYLSSAYEAENFDFYGKKLSGAQEMKPRWKRVCETADFCLGEALGQEYVKAAFSEDSKKRMEKMITDIKASYSERLSKLDWMNDSTKQFAQNKLNTMVVKVGYPDVWRDYGKLNIDKGPYILNVMHSLEFESQRNFDKIGQPVDRKEWGMTPQTVNAYYNPSMNEIVFPAAILQPPFFDPKADDAVNYAAIGAVIGHEITHGFDDEGRQFDSEGNLKQWWTDSDDKMFKERTGVIVSQYNTYSPLDSLTINGELTLGENIADFGGLTIAYYAFQKTDEAKSAELIDGFTPAQRFFIGFARIWAGAYRDEAMRNQLLTNPHSPGMYRVNGVVANMPEWYAAFNIQPTDKLYRAEADRARIW